MKTECYKRVVDEILAFDLECMGAVLIEGPKWCGKTRTGEEQAKSVIKLQDPDNVAKYQAAMKAKPTVLLEGPTPRLIDEWQDFFAEGRYLEIAQGNDEVVFGRAACLDYNAEIAAIAQAIPRGIALYWKDDGPHHMFLGK